MFVSLFFFFLVLVSKPTGQIAKRREQSYAPLSLQPVKPVWAPCQESHAFWETTVSDPVLFRPPEAF